MNTFSAFRVWRRVCIPVALLTCLGAWVLSGFGTLSRSSVQTHQAPWLVAGPMPSGSPWAAWR